MNEMKIEGYDAVAGVLVLRAVDTGRCYGLSVDAVSHAIDNPDAHNGPVKHPVTPGPYSGMPAPDAPGGPNVPPDLNTPQDPDGLQRDFGPGDPPPPERTS